MDENQELAAEFGAIASPSVETVEQPAPQVENQPAQQQETPEQIEQRNAGNRVPLSEHLSVRERAQAAERERDELRRQLQQRETARQAEPPKRTEWNWDKPEQFVSEHTQETVQKATDPIMTALMFNSRLVAHQVHGAELAQNAEQAFNEASAKGEIDPATHARINNSPNPFHAAVEWYRQREVLQKVGGDLSAYETKLLDEKLKDPEFLAKAVAAHQAAQQERAANGQFTKPTNVTRLPPSLNRATGAASMPTGDVSDEDMARAFGAR